MSKEIQSLAVLSTRDQQQFKNIVQLYDQRIYKRALKLTETMLKKYPKQCDLLSMKAFIIGALYPGNKDERHNEAYECAKEAIKQNMKSPMSWHCLGTLYKGDFDYNEAIKCFKTALRFDKEDLVVLRDLATCYIQIRNYSGFREIRNEMKRLRPDIRANWIASALGNHFCGYINSSVNCLLSINQFGITDGALAPSNVSTPDESNFGALFPFLDPFQRSELLLYFVRVLLDGKKYQQTYNLLRANREFILDKNDYYTVMGNLLIKCNQNYTAECAECFERLLCMYPDDDFALFGCMLTDKSLRNVVLPPPHASTQLIQGFKLQHCGEDQQPSSEGEAVLPICGIRSGFFHTRGTSGIMYYPLLVNDSVGRNKGLESKRLSSRESRNSYGYKQSEGLHNRVLEFIIYDDCELDANRVEYENSMRRIQGFFQEKRSQFPASDTIVRLELAFLRGEDFSRAFRAYVSRKLVSRITGLKSLITYLIQLDGRKKDLIHNELVNMVKESEESYERGGFDKHELVTLYYIYSQHLDCMGLPQDGLGYIEKAIGLDDSRPDGFNIKRRLLKHLFRFEEAFEAIDHARLMEKNDKYLNTRTVCASLEIGNFEKAKELLQIFMAHMHDKSKSKGGEQVMTTESEIRNLQIIWYEKRSAMFRELLDTTGDGYLMAFDHYLRLMDSMEIMKTDQYDYHLYCLRKLTLCRYLDFINMQDKIFCSKNYRSVSLVFWRKLWMNISRIKHDRLELPSIKEKEKQGGKNKAKSSGEAEGLKETVEFIKSHEECWKKTREIINNYRSDCIFYAPSYIPTYVQYYCSQRVLDKLSLETCILVCSQSVYRTFVLEKSYLSEGQVGMLPVLLAHFCKNLLPYIKDGHECISKEYRACIKEAVSEQLQALTGTKHLEIENIGACIQNYISGLNVSKISDIESLSNLVKLSIVDSSFRDIEAYLDDMDIDLHRFTGVFNQQIFNLVKLLLIRSIQSGNSDTEPLNACQSQVLEKIATNPRAKLLNRILSSYNIQTRSFVHNQSQDCCGISILKTERLKDQILKEVMDISNLPILALSI
ncbi:putative n-terminal acetyltransferase [Cryptosporidium canis]|nr:putative n-terminal acetyltransferase [Cryptosporidium canis]